MGQVAANMVIILEMETAVYSSKLQRFPTAPICASGQSDVFSLLRGIKYNVRQPKLHDCQLYTGHCPWERHLMMIVSNNPWVNA